MLLAYYFKPWLYPINDHWYQSIIYRANWILDKPGFPVELFLKYHSFSPTWCHYIPLLSLWGTWALYYAFLLCLYTIVPDWVLFSTVLPLLGGAQDHHGWVNTSGNQSYPHRYNFPAFTHKPAWCSFISTTSSFSKSTNKSSSHSRILIKLDILPERCLVILVYLMITFCMNTYFKSTLQYLFCLHQDSTLKYNNPY